MTIAEATDRLTELIGEDGRSAVRSVIIELVRSVWSRIHNRFKNPDQIPIAITDKTSRVDDEGRLLSQSKQILRRLCRGPVLNTELSRITSRYGARIRDLRVTLDGRGWIIESRRIKNGLWSYRLVRRQRVVPPARCPRSGLGVSGAVSAAPAMPRPPVAVP